MRKVPDMCCEHGAGVPRSGQAAGFESRSRLPERGNNTNQYTIMDNNTENKKMMVKLSELREWMDAGQVEFDVPGLVLAVDLDQTLAVVNVDAIEKNDRRKSKLQWLHSGLSHLAGEVLRGNPKAVGVVAEWAERHYAEEGNKGLLGKLAAALGYADQEGEE